MATEKQRLDVLVHERGLAPSREMARRYILAGEIWVNGERHTKVGTRFSPAVDIQLQQAQPYVSRGGYKLATALKAFAMSTTGRICADVGASTGGFTDCLLQAGVARVYAIDVGYGHLALKLRQDERVIVMERTNARHLETLPEKVSLVVIDASFISLKLLLPVVKAWLTDVAEVIPLIKPQFEAGKKEVSRGGGVIKDDSVQKQALHDVLSAAQQMGYTLHGLVASEVTGPKGNREFLAWLKWGAADKGLTPEELIQALFGRASDADPPQ
jgi:23S rRNA (cytidine1920-2'-O)/16S rRNA (cytidine1409-2'-O)-methyltransferase